MGESYADMEASALVALVPCLRVPLASGAVKDLDMVICGGSVGGLAAAACLRAAGFTKVKVLERAAAGLRAGAGVGVDDASLAILKGLGVEIELRPARWIEERISGEALIQRQPYPYWSSRYVDVVEGLLTKVDDIVSFSHRATNVEIVDDKVRVVSAKDNSEEEEEEEVRCDVAICADGPRSPWRKLVYREDEEVPLEFMRYAGYFAWRGVVQKETLTEEVRKALYEEMDVLGNALYFLHARKSKSSAVLYDIGKGVLNWLVYENREVPPSALKNRTTSGIVSDDEINKFLSTRTSDWGFGFGELLNATPRESIFQTDVYDLKEPLPRLAQKGIAILGDAAHAVTPHAAKGSNMALHDAFALAYAAQTATSRDDWLSKFSSLRLDETTNVVRTSRMLGRLRQGMLSEVKSEQDFLDVVFSDPYIEPRMLPASKIFDDVWNFSLAHKQKQSSNDFYLVKHRPLKIEHLNHVSRETSCLPAMIDFYRNVLGLKTLPRPSFGFGGIWFELQKGIALHIIVRDERKGPKTKRHAYDESFIRRDNHIALTVKDIDVVKHRLTNHGLNYATNSVPGKDILQLFIYDPEGYGVEIGNFDNV